ncbi:hypothetical protein WMY93_007643 [Mugilogobius chulae]|uniref:Gypsy retrotransposon integrase-like protein 1 n=1 Tax=Mugilogobius chulae TaxID=88201 RepID=A0AAW0PME0_9GOBI
MIDFVVVSSDLQPRALDTRVKRGAELSTDHHLVVSWIRWQRTKPDRFGRPTRIIRVCWERLAESSVIRVFNSHLWEGFSQLPGETEDIESKWTMFSASIVNAAAQNCGCKVSGACRAAIPEPGGGHWNDRYLQAKRTAALAVAEGKTEDWQRFGETMEETIGRPQRNSQVCLIAARSTHDAPTSNDTPPHDTPTSNDTPPYDSNDVILRGGRKGGQIGQTFYTRTRESRRHKRDGRKTGATRSTGQTRKSQPPNHGTAQDTRPDLHEPSENTTKRHTRRGRGNSASEERSHTWSGQKTEHREVKSGQRQGVKALPRRDRRRGNQRTGGRGGSQELSTVTLYNSRGRGNPALSCRLKKCDRENSPSDSALRDQLLLGLRDGPLAQALKVYARRNPDQDFAALRQEALLLDSEYGPSTSEVTCFAVNKQYASPRTPQEEHWKEQLKREIMEDVKAQMKGLTQEIVAELRPMMQPPPVHSATPTPPPTYPRRNAPYSDRDERVFKCPQTSNLSQHFKQQKAWRDAFATCSRIEAVPAEDGLLGHVRLASKKNVTVPPKSEQMVWGRAKVGTRGANYCALVEPLPGAGGVGVAKSLVMVKGGRLPVRVCNPHPYSVSIGRFEKIGQLCCVDAADVHGADDVSLSLVEDDIVEVALVKAADTQVSPEVRDLSNRSDLSEQQQEQLSALLVKWEKVFAQHDEDFGRTNLVQHRIPTGDAAPVRERYRPIPPLLYKEVKSLLSGMLEQGVIKESCSPWAAPIVLVRKKDGSWRFCVDYRKLNAVTHKDAFPLPRIEETLTSLSKSEWFSTLDLASGYWQVEMHPDDREKTAFTTPLGLFEFERMPFGLCNAPATFQRLMQQCLNGQIAESLLVYLDDIIIYSADFSSHLQHLDQVFERLWQHGLKLKPDKCKLLQREVTFLGHVVDRNGVRPDPGKIKAVQDWSAPTTVKEVRAFLGLAGYYRRFVAGFAKIARPLNRLLTGIPANKRTQARKVHWTPECQHSFDALKAALTSAPILAYAHYEQPFIVYTDASNQGLGAVLSQVQDGHERVIAYASRSLHPTEQNDANYSSFKLELLALKWAVTEKFKDYLTGAQFTIYTDNNPLAHLQTANLGAVEQRWVAQLASFDYTVKYRSGKTNVNADVLSRFPVPTERDRMPEDPGPMVAAVEMTPNGEEWKEAQALDPDIQTVRRYVEWKRFPKRAERLSLSQTAQKLLQHWRRLEVRNDVLYRVVADKDTLEERPQIVCPNTRREEVWRSVHEAGAHFGPEKTLSRLRQQFYWPGMEGEERSHTWSGQKTEHREVKSGQRQGVKALPRRDRRRGNQRTGGRGGSQELSTVTLYNSRGRGNPALSVMVDVWT